KEKALRPAHTKSKMVVNSIVAVNNSELVRYLKKRGISPKTWTPYLEQANYTNGGFAGCALAFKNDSEGYELRTAKFKGCYGNKDITTLLGSPEELLLFEGFMDFLSFVQLGKWSDESVIVLNSTVNSARASKQALSLGVGIRVTAYLDNDTAGRDALQAIRNEIPGVIDGSNLYGKFKDLNDMLMKQIQRSNNLSM
ncbi:MAG: toprim domain-containing protein, partial [Imperialibacter sp.]